MIILKGSVTEDEIDKTVGSCDVCVLDLQLIVDKLTEKTSWLRQKQQEWIGDYFINSVSFKGLVCMTKGAMEFKIKFGPWYMPHVFFWGFGIAVFAGWYHNTSNTLQKANGFGRYEWLALGLRPSKEDELVLKELDRECKEREVAMDCDPNHMGTEDVCRN